MGKREDSRRGTGVGGLFRKIPRIIKIILVLGCAFLLVLLGTFVPNQTKHSETVVNFGFEDVGELVTQEWYGRILEDSSKDRKIFNSISLPFTESRMIFSLDVEVLAALNFKEISYELKKRNNGENIVVISLPHAQIYKSYEVQNSFKSYLDTESWFTNFNSTEQQNLKDAVVEKGKEQAIEAGILDKADKNAETIIRNMVRENEVTKNFQVEFNYK